MRQKKRNTGKITICIIGTVALITVLCPLMVYAEEIKQATIYTEEYFEYYIEEESITICGYFGSEREVTIPSAIAGYPVSKLAVGAFSESDSVEMVNLPDTIMSIEEGALSGKQKVTYNSNIDETDRGDTNTPTEAEGETKDTSTDVTTDASESVQPEEEEVEQSFAIEEQEIIDYVNAGSQANDLQDRDASYSAAANQGAADSEAENSESTNSKNTNNEKTNGVSTNSEKTNNEKTNSENANNDIADNETTGKEEQTSALSDHSAEDGLLQGVVIGLIILILVIGGIFIAVRISRNNRENTRRLSDDVFCEKDEYEWDKE